MDIKDLESVLKKLESVYKSTLDSKQKERVRNEITKIKDKINDLEQFGEEKVLEENERQDETIVKKSEDILFKSKKDFKILSEFPVQKIHDQSNDPEVNAVITYINVFENELWGALSDYHLKLDYFHSKERDKFYNTLENVKRFIREYVNTLNEFNSSANESFIEKLKLMRNKYSRSLIMDSVKLIMKVKEFLEKLVDDYESEGHIILNSDQVIHFSGFEGSKLLNKWNIIDALKYIRDFCGEFIDAINFPQEMLNEM